MLAEALIDGSLFGAISGTKSVGVETPALKAASDDEWLVLVGEMHTGFFHMLPKCQTLSSLGIPKNSNPTLYR